MNYDSFGAVDDFHGDNSGVVYSSAHDGDSGIPSYEQMKLMDELFGSNADIPINMLENAEWNRTPGEAAAANLSALMVPTESDVENTDPNTSTTQMVPVNTTSTYVSDALLNGNRSVGQSTRTRTPQVSNGLQNPILVVPIPASGNSDAVGGLFAGQSSVTFNSGISLSNGMPSHQIAVKTILSPSQKSPALVERLQNGVRLMRPMPVGNGPLPKQVHTVSTTVEETRTTKVYPKPQFSYSCLIALALKNSETGSLPVSEIYSFMTNHFPYFKTAPDGWKNSVRHNLSLNKCFDKVENPKLSSGAKKGCLWGMNPAKRDKMDEEILKSKQKDLDGLRKSMAYPDQLELIERGQAGIPHDTGGRLHAHTPTSSSSDSPLHAPDDVFPSQPDVDGMLVGLNPMDEIMSDFTWMDNLPLDMIPSSESVPLYGSPQPSPHTPSLPSPRPSSQDPCLPVSVIQGKYHLYQGVGQVEGSPNHSAYFYTLSAST